MAFRKLQTIQALYRASQIRQSSYLLGNSTTYSADISNGFGELNCRKMSSFLYKGQNSEVWNPFGHTAERTLASEKELFKRDVRYAGTHALAQAQKAATLKVSMLSPGFVYEPYAPREKLPFFQRWFTISGWKKTKDDIILELKSAFAVSKLRKTGYSKQLFYKEAAELYKKINNQIASGDKKLLRKTVTEMMYSALKNELRQRESKWSKVHWEMIEPIVKMRTLRARLIGVERDNLDKVFVQLTIEFITKQKFEAYDYDGNVVAGDKSKEVLVKDIWVFEKSLFHTGAYWRLCGRLTI